MKTLAEVTFKDDMSFEVGVNGHKLMIDAIPEVGGKDRGPRPNPLVLAVLGGCTRIDVNSILREMRMEPDDFNVAVATEMTNEHPKNLNKIHLTYEFRGKDLPMDKLITAINLTHQLYCGVTAMLDKVAKITHEIIILD